MKNIKDEIDSCIAKYEETQHSSTLFEQVRNNKKNNKSKRNKKTETYQKLKDLKQEIIEAFQQWPMEYNTCVNIAKEPYEDVENWLREYENILQQKSKISTKPTTRTITKTKTKTKTKTPLNNFEIEKRKELRRCKQWRGMLVKLMSNSEKVIEEANDFMETWLCADVEEKLGECLMILKHQNGLFPHRDDRVHQDLRRLVTETLEELSKLQMNPKRADLHRLAFMLEGMLNLNLCVD